MEYVNALLTLITLTALEVVLAIDNVVFLIILTKKLPKNQGLKARSWGMFFAWILRLALLVFAVYLTKLNYILFYLGDIAISGRALFFIFGGMFLIIKVTQEIHHELEATNTSGRKERPHVASFWGVVIQIAVMDIVFSLDSILTAVGLSSNIWIMSTAITITILAMIFLSSLLSNFIEKHPTFKILAFCFLIFIGVLLIADGLSYHVPRGYLYMGMGIAFFAAIVQSFRARS